MNLLPFVLIIVVILSLFSLSQFERSIVQKKETQIYLAYFKGLRETRNRKATLGYKKSLPKKKRAPTLSKTPSTKESDHPYFRIARIGWDQGKLNLSSLISTPYRHPILKKVFAHYVRELYGHASFFPKRESFPEELLDALVESYKRVDLSTPFYHLNLRNGRLHPIFYKMVRGTHTYDLEKKIGYPPLGEMLTFEKSERPPMNFHYANPSFLSAVLGRAIQKELIELEKTKLETARSHSRSPLKKSEFIALLTEQMVEDKKKVVSLFDFSYRSSRSHPEKYQDPDTQITVKIS